MPLSSMFLNNMVIFAGLLKFNIQMAVCILLAVVLYAVLLVLLQVLTKDDLSLMPKGDKLARLLRLK